MNTDVIDFLERRVIECDTKLMILEVCCRVKSIVLRPAGTDLIGCDSKLMMGSIYPNFVECGTK